jgi:pilus assembly protein CpaB
MPNKNAGAVVTTADGTLSVGTAAPAGPTVRVTRGKETTVETVSRGAGAVLDRQARGAGQVGRTAPAALGTLR